MPLRGLIEGKSYGCLVRFAVPVCLLAGCLATGIRCRQSQTNPPVIRTVLLMDAFGEPDTVCPCS